MTHPKAPRASETPEARKVEALLVAGIAKTLKIPEGRIDVHAPLSRYELDSVEAAQLAGRLEKALGRKVELTLFFESTSLQALSLRLARASRDAV